MGDFVVSRPLGANLVAFSTLPTMPVHSGVLRGELMSVLAVGLAGINSHRAISSQDVDANQDGFQMSRSDTGMNSAEMIECHFRFERSYQQFPGLPVCENGFPFLASWPDSKASVSGGIGSGSPKPAVTGLINLRPETVSKGHLGAALVGRAGANPMVGAETSGDGLRAALTGTNSNQSSFSLPAVTFEFSGSVTAGSSIQPNLAETKETFI